MVGRANVTWNRPYVSIKEVIEAIAVGIEAIAESGDALTRPC